MAGLAVGVHRQSGHRPEVRGETVGRPRALPAADPTIGVRASVRRVTAASVAAASVCAALAGMGMRGSFW